MKLEVLGCSAAELPDARLTSFLINDKVLLDAGTIGSVLDEKRQWKIRHILLTHAHLDHIKDLPFLADNIALNNKRHSVTVFSVPEVIRALKNHVFNNVVWPDFTSIPSAENPVLRFESISLEKSYKINGLKVIPVPVKHVVPSVGYLLEDSIGKRLLYLGDTGPNKSIWDFLKGVHLHGMIVEVSLPDKYKEIALKTGHMTPGLLNLELNNMPELPENIYISHYKPPYKKRIKEEIASLAFSNVRVLEDGDVHEI